MVKHFLLFCVGSFLLISSFAQHKETSWLGTKTSYEPQQHNYTPVPNGFHTIFINHVGRHGSRYMTKAGEDSLLFEIFTKAKKENVLTIIGKKWEPIINWLVQQQSDKYADITLLGKKEHHDIASRMIKQYPKLFVGKDIEVWYTHKARTLQSAKGFISAFPKNQSSSWKIQSEEAETMLRFYDYSPTLETYQNSNAIQLKNDSLEQLIHLDAVTTHIAARFIKPSIWEKWKKDKQTILVKGKNKTLSPKMFALAFADFYGVLQSTKIELEEAGISLKKLGVPFTEKERIALGKLDNLASDWEKGPSINHDGIQVKVATPLLSNMVATSDSLINGAKKQAGIFRFTHAEAISPMATLMGLQQADSVFTSVRTFGNEIWNAAEIIPMAANIQWIFYSNSKDILVKFLLNEKESRIPVATDLYPYYHWENVRSYFLSKMPVDYNNPTFDWLHYLKELH